MVLNPLQKLTNKIRRLFQRAQVRRVSYQDKVRYLQMIGEGGQPLSDIEHLEPFGFTSHPLPGAESIALAFNGNGSHAVALMVGDKRFAVQITEGECAIYNQHGDKVHIKNDRSISVDAAIKVQLNTPLVECLGIVKAEDFQTTSGVSVNNHDHDDPESGKTSKANPS